MSPDGYYRRGLPECRRGRPSRPLAERLIEAAAALGKSLSCVGDEDQVEIALAPDVAASERAEENRPPHAESRQRPHDSLALCLEPSPAALARSPVHDLSVLRPVPDRHDARSIRS